MLSHFGLFGLGGACGPLIPGIFKCPFHKVGILALRILKALQYLFKVCNLSKIICIVGSGIVCVVSSRREIIKRKKECIVL
jgi:hypothetical protein